MIKVIASILILVATILMALLLYPANDEHLPERVSIYLSEESRIITLDYRDYLAGCMFAVIYPESGKEALNAVACAVNSRALYLLKTRSRSSFMGADLSDDEDLCQPYITAEEALAQLGERYESCRERIYEAVDFGMKHIITYNGEIISAQICRFSTGMTDSSESLPYLSETTVAADENADDAVSTRVFSDDMVMRTLSKQYGVTSLPDRREMWFSQAVYLPSGTLKEIYFGDKRLSGKQLKQAFDLRSAAITIEYAEQRFVFTIKGWGENLGMSINGACVMARRGCNCEEILEHFYHGSLLTDI